MVKFYRNTKFKILRGPDVMHFRKLPLVAPRKGSYIGFIPGIVFSQPHPVLIKKNSSTESNCYVITAVL